MAIQEWKCLECGKKFKPGEYECVPGQMHVVASKRYYMADAPTVGEIRDGVRFINKGVSQTVILNIPPEKLVRHGDEMAVVPGGSVVVVRGLLETSNPEQQFWLDKKECWCTEERWREVYLNDDEKAQIRNLELAAREQQVRERENALLSKVKAAV